MKKEVFENKIKFLLTGIWIVILALCFACQKEEIFDQNKTQTIQPNEVKNYISAFSRSKPASQTNKKEQKEKASVIVHLSKKWWMPILNTNTQAMVVPVTTPNKKLTTRMVFYKHEGELMKFVVHLPRKDTQEQLSLSRGSQSCTDPDGGLGSIWEFGGMYFVCLDGEWIGEGNTLDEVVVTAEDNDDTWNPWNPNEDDWYYDENEEQEDDHNTGGGGDGGNDDEFGPSCESFDFQTTTTDAYWQNAAVKNIRFRVVVLSPQGSYINFDIKYSQPILFGVPTNMVINL